jgi:nucleotide-binding universal stress UspA family protein
VKWAVAFCCQVGATLNLIHVVPRMSDWPSLAAEQRLQDKVRDEARRSLDSLLQQEGIGAPLRVAAGAVVEAVTETARQERSDLVIVGRGAISEPFGRLRTHAAGIVHRAPCPVISV